MVRGKPSVSWGVIPRSAKEEREETMGQPSCKIGPNFTAGGGERRVNGAAELSE